MPESESQLFLIHFLLCIPWEVSGDGSNSFISAIHVGDPDSHLLVWPGPAQSVTGIWGLKQQTIDMAHISLSFS